jgi:uncharacterized protein YaaN involved in tellurite resistance
METKTKEIIETAIEENTNDINADLVAVQPEEKSQLEKALSELDFTDRTSIIYFGASAQEELDSISNRMIDGVKNKDTGAAGMVLNEMVAAIKGFDIEELNPNKSQPWYEKLFGGVKPLTKFIQGYEEVRDQIDMIANNLEEHKSTLMRDVVSLDKLYDANLDYFRKLELYIEAGELKKKELASDVIPQYEEKAKSSEMMAIQELKEIRSFADDLERRVHDLRLSRQVSMQSLPSIRLIQDNDKSLINKISSTLVNTVPLWRNQLAQTVTIFRSHESAKALKDAADLTNELLERNAEGLRDANREVRTQMERGVFDIESIKKANDTLIATLNDSLEIADAGKEARTKALVELEKTEHELKEALLATKAKAEAIPTATKEHITEKREG